MSNINEAKVLGIGKHTDKDIEKLKYRLEKASIKHIHDPNSDNSEKNLKKVNKLNDKFNKVYQEKDLQDRLDALKKDFKAKKEGN